MVDNISNKKCFKAEYNYGPPSERIKIPNPLAAFINALIVRLFKIFIYPAASIIKKTIIDSERIEKARHQLLSIGGQSVTMKTPDGDKIDGMYLSAKDFRAQLEKYCKCVEIDNGDGTVKQTLHLKPEFCQSMVNDKKPFTYMKPNAEAEDFINNMKGLGICYFPKDVISLEENIRGPTFILENIPKECPHLNNENSSISTAIISPGSGMSYAAYKGLAAAYLTRGINVMMVDFRGYGKSEGSPTDVRTKLDLDTAYQYLQVHHKVKNEELIVHGHCLGGASASDLASRRPGVNLILDRTFSDYREMARERFPIIGKIIHAIMPSIVNYNTGASLQNVKGNVAIVMATEDKVIPENQIIKLIDHLPDSQKDKHYKLIDTKGGHVGLWTDDTVTSQKFNQFLDQIGFRKRLF